MRRSQTFFVCIAYAVLAHALAAPPAEQNPKGLAPIEPVEYQYGEADGEKLLVDVYWPPTGANAGAPARTPQARPAVLLVHGGGWCIGSRKDVAPDARFLAWQGYVAFGVGYRLGNGPERLKDSSLPARNRYPAALDDCQRAVRWVRSKADEFQIDPNRIAAIGWSAGGHLVSLLGTIDTRDNSDPALAKFSSRVAAVINVYGPTDFTHPLPETNLFGNPPDEKSDLWLFSKPVRWLQDEFLGSTADSIRREASPLHHIDSRTTPFLLVHGIHDKAVPIEQSRVFLKALKQTGVEASLIEFSDEGHGIGKEENKQRFANETAAFLRRALR